MRALFTITVTYIEIRGEDEELIETEADNNYSVYAQVSASLIVKCNPGQAVWARAGRCGYLFNGNGLSHFPEFLLYLYV